MTRITTPAMTQQQKTAVDAPSMPRLRQPVRADGYAISQLIESCPPLDVNSVYTYLLLAEHFSATSVVAEADGRIVGFISAYRHPERSNVLFVWQVAVHESARGMGLGKRMLQDLLTRPHLADVRYLETTVGPDNVASRRMFSGLAETHQADVQEEALFGAELFGPQAHDEERLIRIGPITN